MKYRSYNNGSNYFWLGILIFIAFGGIKTLFLLLGVFLSILPFLLFFGAIIWVLRLIVKNTQILNGIQGFGIPHNRFVELFIHISIHAIKADGKVDQSELSALKQFFIQQLHYRGAQLNWINDLIQDGLKQTHSLSELCEEFKTNFPGEPRLILLDMVYRIISSDGVITDSEQTIANKIAMLLSVPNTMHNRIKSAYQTYEDKSEKYYAILGLSKNASKTELKKAYHKATKEHHPDKVQHLGDDIRQVAEEKIKDINKAYDYLSKIVA